jgi:hypothetical protein
MRKNLLLFASVVCSLILNAQSAEKVFGSPTIVYYGIDFTKAKMIGLGDESPHKIRDEYFKAWNEITIDMDLAKTFQKNSVAKDPNGISKLNFARETETLKSDKEIEFAKESIADMVKQMPVGQKKVGVGLVFIVQSFNKTAEAATVHVVFFDIADRTVLWQKKMTGKPSGGTAKSAWATALKDIFSQIEKKEYKAWKKEANF